MAEAEVPQHVVADVPRAAVVPPPPPVEIDRVARLELAVDHLWHHLSEGTIQGLDDFKQHWRAKLEEDQKGQN
jgi:hypothetical protein